jgi:serine/threonine protein phosphatase PrpC
VAALFDGVGGNRGEVLLTPAIDAWSEAMTSPGAPLRAGLDAVAVAVQRTVASDPKLRGGGIAGAAVALRGPRAHVARAGDITVMHWRATGLERLDADDLVREVRDGDRFFLLSPALAQATEDAELEAAATFATPASAAATLMQNARTKGAGRQLSALVIAVRTEGDEQALAEPPGRPSLETGIARSA